MKILDPGHSYLIDLYDGKDCEAQELTFMKREGDNFPFNSGSHPGTNCQEVTRALIDRCEYLNKQKPCWETEAIIGLYKTALALFEARAIKIDSCSGFHYQDLNSFSRESTCDNCGHIQCNRKKCIKKKAEAKSNEHT